MIGWLSSLIRSGRRNGHGPDSYDWRAHGALNREVPSAGGVGVETPGAFTQTQIGFGERYGAARVPDSDALGDSAAPNRFAAAGGKVRIGVFEDEHIQGTLGAKQLIAQRDALKDAAVERGDQLRKRLLRLVEQVLPDRKQELAEASDIVDAGRAKFDALPRDEQGLIPWFGIVAAIEVGVATFDGAVLHGILERAGLGVAALWGTTFTVPVAVWACNRVLGTLAGAVALRVEPRRRLHMAVAALLGGLAALGIAFGAVAIFRDQAIEAQNTALRAIAEGDTSTMLDFFVSPLWMGPLQVAASLAAIAAVGIWTMGRPGRDQQVRIDDAEEERAERKSAVKETERQIEDTHHGIEEAATEVHNIDARAAAAEAEIEVGDAAFEARRAAELGLAESMAARYEAERTYVDKIFANGGVWRCAMPTMERLFRNPYNPAPQDQSSSNGRGA